MLVNSLGPIELWALSTTPGDTGLRNRLYDRVGFSEGLRRTINRVSGDMARIGGMRPVSYAGAAATPVVPDELQKPVHFVWSGALDDGVRKLAASVGYSVAVVAPPNARPVAVAINVDGQVIGAFQALGDQAGTRATVEVDPFHHQVEVIHHV